MNLVKLTLVLVMLLLVNSINVFGQSLSIVPNNKQKYNDKEAQEEIGKIFNRLTAGETMEDMAKEISQDPGTFLRGGVIGFVNPINLYVNDFILGIENLKVDELSKPFRTQFGYHVAKILFKKKDKMIIQHILIRVQE